MMSYAEFGKLRLRDFYSKGIERSKSPTMEWKGGMWYYESIGFTWFGRLEEVTDETGALEIDFSELPASASEKILNQIGLPVRPGMTHAALLEVLGEPQETTSFVADRNSYYFKLGSSERYHVLCVVQETEGLIFVSVAREDVLAQIKPAPSGQWIRSEEEKLVENNDINRLSEMIDKGYDINARDEYGRSLLDRAVILNRPEVVKFLFNRGAKLNKSGEIAKQNLEFFPQFQEMVDLIKQLEQSSRKWT